MCTIDPLLCGTANCLHQLFMGERKLTKNELKSPLFKEQILDMTFSEALFYHNSYCDYCPKKELANA